MEPTAGLVVRPAALGGRELRPDTYVWVWAVTDREVEIEYRNQRGLVPRDAVVSTPVTRPSLEVLRQLDPCFGLDRDAFVIEHEDPRWFFLLRCKAHGRRFLSDARGGIAQYERVTLLEDSEANDTEGVWRRCHAMSDDYLNLLGRTL